RARPPAPAAPSPSRDRHRNGPLAWLLDHAAKYGFADVELVRALARAGVEPVGPGSDETDLAVRWAAMLKSARARARISVDKTYSSVDNHAVLDRLGVEAYIPFKVNAVVNPKAPAWSRHLCEFLLNQ